MKLNKITSLLILLLTITSLLSCNDDNEPTKEDTPELITKATIVFTATGEAPVSVMATDNDGEGPEDLVIEGPFNLKANTTYTCTINLINGLANPNDAAYDISAEVAREADEHLFLYAWTNNIFSSPEGNGNIDNRADAVNYADEDDGGLPLGLQTTWTTGVAATGTFRIVLKHQPEIKSSTSGMNDGETDLDLTFTVNIQ